MCKSQSSLIVLNTTIFHNSSQKDKIHILIFILNLVWQFMDWTILMARRSVKRPHT